MLAVIAFPVSLSSAELLVTVIGSLDLSSLTSAVWGAVWAKKNDEGANKCW